MRFRWQVRGRVLVGGALLALLSGAAMEDGALMALGLAGLIMAAFGAWLVRWNLRGVEILLSVPSVVHVGQPGRAGARLTNPRRVTDAFRLRLEMEWPSGGSATCWIPWLGAGASAWGEVRASFRERGAGKGVSYRLGSGFPLDWFHCETEGFLKHEWSVVPKPLRPLEWPGEAAWMDPSSSPLEAGPGAGWELAGLREFRSGDPVRAVVWPASVRSLAQGGGLISREMPPPARTPRRVVLVFHSYGGEGTLIRPDRFERAVSLVWGTLRLLREGGAVAELVADFEEWVPVRVNNMADLARAGVVLSRAHRAESTEAHEVEARLEEWSGVAEVWIFSDMPVAAWGARFAGRGVPVDVAAYESRKGGRRRG